MVHGVHHETFRSGSKTYFNSTRFFPEAVRDDVYLLYGFVRVADNYVDQIPQDGAGFEAFVSRYNAAMAGTPADDPIIDGFVELSHRREFDPAWTDAFLHSMRMDLHKKRHVTLPESLEYIYGSAEVIGLFMARVMGLEEAAYHPAMMLGRAMQFINFIRDVAEDNSLGRIYLPISECALDSLEEAETRAKPDVFRDFIHQQLARYMTWQTEAEAGYPLIPRRYRIPVKTAGDMYKWTGQTIAADPFVIYQRKVKPARARIVFAGLLNTVAA